MVPNSLVARYYLASLCLLCCILRISCSEFDYTVTVDAGKMNCYYQSVDNVKYKTMEVDYQVIDDRVV